VGRGRAIWKKGAGMSNAITGSKGFLGSALKRYADKYLPNEEWVGIHRGNRDLWAEQGNKWNTVIWAAGTADKRLCETNKSKCLDLNVIQLAKTLREFPCDKFVYISSQSVYPDGWVPPVEEFESYQEEDVSDIDNLSTYGASKYLGELIVQEYTKSYLCIRPNGFTGPGLKKNVVYDLLANDPPRLFVSWDSKFQYIHVDDFARILFILAAHTTRRSDIYNVTSPDVVTPIDVANLHNIDIKKVKDKELKNRVQAVISTKKLEGFLRSHSYYVPSSKEAIKNWNESLSLQMHQVRVRVG